MINKHNCTGCTACKYICPVNAIDIKIDNLTGFHLANVNPDICIGCNKCESVCPNLTGNVKSSQYIYKKYILQMDQKFRKNSSSGGAFMLLGKYFAVAGFKIAGVVWDEKFNASYAISNNPALFQGSKYVQPDIKDIFVKIKELLDQGEKILFVGLPCHTAGLINYLGDSYTNLWTIDLLCNSIPSPKIWQMWLQEYGIDVNDIKDIHMRRKLGWGVSNPILKINTNDNSMYYVNLRSTGFYKLGIREKLTISRTCHTCKYRSLTSHKADFTIGDVFGKQTHIGLYWDSNESSISFISCNKTRSNKLFKDKIVPKYQKYITICENTKISGNTAPSDPEFLQNKINAGEKIFNMLGTKKLSTVCQILESNRKTPYDIALAGGTLCNNFGGNLTYYALYKFLEKNDYNTIIIPPIPDSLGVVMPDNLFTKNCIVSPNHFKGGEQIKFNRLAKLFIIGSDQMWNRNLFEEHHLTPYLDYLYDGKKKIAYGVSYGKYIPDMGRPSFNNVKKLINGFDFISHREEQGCEKTSKYYNRYDTEHVIDPVFFFNRDFYTDLIKDSNVCTDIEYVCLYDLGFNENQLDFIEDIVNGEGCSVKYITTGNYHKLQNKKLRFPSENPISVQDWLKYIHDSKFVITNSYHGICLSIILRKQFIYIGTPDDRINDILDMCNLSERVIDECYSDDLYKVCNLLHTNIDWNSIDELLSSHIEKSKKWLLESIKKCI